MLTNADVKRIFDIAKQFDVDTTMLDFETCRNVSKCAQANQWDLVEWYLVKNSPTPKSPTQIQREQIVKMMVR